jgi:CheY-specific phosphatase CheX
MNDELALHSLAVGEDFKDLIPPVVERSVLYLNEEIGVKIKRVYKVSNSVEKRRLRRMTAIVAVNGRFNFMISMSFDKHFLDEMFSRMTEGMDVAPDEEDLYKREAAGDMANTIIGNCTHFFERPNERVHLSPPLILEGGRNVQAPANAVHYGIRLKTDIGFMDIDFYC